MENQEIYRKIGIISVFAVWYVLGKEVVTFLLAENWWYLAGWICSTIYYNLIEKSNAK